MKLFVDNSTKVSVLLTICLIAYNYVDGPVSFAIASAFLLLNITKDNYKMTEIKFLFPVFLICFIGIIAGLLQKSTLTDYLRDIYYFVQPIVYIYTGYYICKKYDSKYDLFFNIVFVAWILSIFYLIRVMQNPSVILQSSDITDIRNEVGKETVIQMVAVILITTQRVNVKRNKILLYAPIVVVFLLQFSRASIGTISIYYLIYFIHNREKFSKKTFRMVFCAFIIIIAFVMLLPEALITDLVSRFAKSLSEVSSGVTTDWNVDTAYQHWRGYEIHIVLEEFNTSNLIQQLFGYGFGHRVQLGSGITLLGMSSIPVFHNGYIQVLSKAGIIGLLLLIIFYLRIYKYADRYKLTNDYEVRNLAKCIMAYTIGILFYSYVKSGIFRGSSILEYCLLVGIFVAKASKLKKTED